MDDMRRLINIASLTEKNDPNEGPDIVELSVPLFIRLLEWAREESPDDISLHRLVENVVGMDRILNSEDYSLLFYNMDQPKD